MTKVLQELGKIGRITYMYQGKESVYTVNRSSGRNIGYKTDKALHKNMKIYVFHLGRQGYPIVSVEVITVVMVATDIKLINPEDL